MLNPLWQHIEVKHFFSTCIHLELVEIVSTSKRGYYTHLYSIGFIKPNFDLFLHCFSELFNSADVCHGGMQYHLWRRITCYPSLANWYVSNKERNTYHCFDWLMGCDPTLPQHNEPLLPYFSMSDKANLKDVDPRPVPTCKTTGDGITLQISLSMLLKGQGSTEKWEELII